MMSSQLVVAEWLACLGRESTGSPWSLDDAGVATFQFDDLEMVVEVDQDDSPVGLYVDLGVTPPENEPDWWLAVLSANFMVTRMDVATLSVHPSSGHLTLGYVLPVEWLDQDSFAGFIRGLMEQAMHWQHNLASLDSGELYSGELYSGELYSGELYSGEL